MKKSDIEKLQASIEQVNTLIEQRDQMRETLTELSNGRYWPIVKIFRHNMKELDLSDFERLYIRIKVSIEQNIRKEMELLSAEIENSDINEVIKSMAEKSKK